MKPLLSILAAIVLVLTLSFPAAGAPEVGGRLPDFSLPVPTELPYRQYLGIESDGKFGIAQVQADVVIVQIFSMYCPHCQREAPTVNRLYEQLSTDPRTRGKVKLIGIGAGNSDFEIGHFRKTYKVQFPLFADGDFHIHKLMGEVRTPFFIGVRILADGGQKIFYSRLGSFGTPEEFIATVVTGAGLE